MCTVTEDIPIPHNLPCYKGHKTPYNRIIQDREKD